MTKINQNASAWSGDYHQLIFSVTDSTGASQNMTGMTACWGLFPEDDLTASLLKKAGTISGSLVIITLATGNTTGSVGRYYHELQLTDASNNSVTAATGILTLFQSAVT